MSTVPAADLGEEREIDLPSLRRRLVARWWIVVAGIVIGAVAGVLVATGGGKVYDAKALLYLGQPFTTAGGQQVTSLATNPRTVSAIVKNEATLEQVSKESGVSVARLRGAVVAQAITAIGTSAGLGRSAPLIELKVQLKERDKAEVAANAFARIVVDEVGGYVDEKIKILEARIEADQEGLATAQQRVQTALEQQRLAQTSNLSLTERFLIQQSTNSTLQFYEARQSNLRFDLNDAQQLLSLAQQVERSRIVQPALAVSTSARNRRNSLIVGALIGLILGGLLAATLPDRAPRAARAPE